MHFLLLRFGLFGITKELKVEMDQSPDPSPVKSLQLLWDEKSIDPEDVRDEKKIELITLHNAMQKLDKGMDYSAVVNPLLADQGPALAHIPRLMIQRLEKIKADFLRN